MKKTLATLCALAILAIGALAGEVYDRTAVLTLSTNGLYSWTNSIEYANIKLVRLNAISMNFITDTVTVARVTGDTRKQTNTVNTIVCAANYGAINLNHGAQSDTTINVSSNVAGWTTYPVYMKAGDVLTFTSGMGSNGYVQVEYIQQRH
jgi:hypothetical protein